MSNHKIERDNYICKVCKHQWSQPCCEVPRCPVCPPFKDFEVAKKTDLFAIEVVDVATPLRFWSPVRGTPAVDAMNAGLFTLDSNHIKWATPHINDGKCRLVSADELNAIRIKGKGESYGKRFPNDQWGVKLRDYTSAERKEMPVWTVLAEYFPDAFAALARHSKKNNDKHNPGERMHWARGKSADHLECAARHLLTPDRKDEVSGETELVAALWRVAAEVQLREEKRLVAAGIRPLSGVVR
jgi:hypothetical protein